jgi:hypothetical protein
MSNPEPEAIVNNKLERDKQRIRERLNDQRKNELVDKIAGWAALALHSKAVKKATDWKNRLRIYVDGEEPDSVEQIFSTKKNQESGNTLIVKVLREVRLLFENRAQPEPKGRIHLPCNFIVLLNSKDDKHLSRVEQDILKKILQMHIYAEALDFAGEAPLASSENDFLVELKVDGTLNDGEIRLVGSFERTRQDTFYSPDGAERIAARLRDKKSKAEEKNSPEALSTKSQGESIDQEVTEYYTGDPYKTTYYNIVKPYNIEVWRDETHLDTLTFRKKTISIGRNWKKGKYDINLPETYVSRPQAWIEVDNENNYWITSAESLNPTFKGEIECPKGQKIKINVGETVQIMDFTLRFPGLTETGESVCKSSHSSSSKAEPNKS